MTMEKGSLDPNRMTIEQAAIYGFVTEPAWLSFVRGMAITGFVIYGAPREQYPHRGKIQAQGRGFSDPGEGVTVGWEMAIPPPAHLGLLLLQQLEIKLINYKSSTLSSSGRESLTKGTAQKGSQSKVSWHSGFRLEPPKYRPVAVVDIGSNSVRLVVYDGLRRSPAPVFNEKILCGLGRGIAITGKLDETAVIRALAALRRFRSLTRQMQCVEVFAVATAAAREATNGEEFIALAE